nr:putative receptor like protein 25 [Ziziphus jujuba var. spinosa]
MERHEYYDGADDILNNNYPKMKSWKVGGDCCSSWDGVSCDMATGYVISLDLSGSWLQGPLHSNSCLFRLLYLRKLNHSLNNFTFCPIPSKFGQLSSNHHYAFYTDYNHYVLVGTLYIKGEFIRLSSNDNLSGSFPKFLSGSMLKLLDLSFTKFSGKVPNSIGNLKSLNILTLNHCSVSGSIPSSIGNLTELKYLDLSENEFSGQIPYSLANLTHIDFSNNKFYGEIPSLIGDARDLIVLNLSSNNFAGYIPSSLGNLIELESLDLSYNELSGGIPQQLTGLTFLGYLNLSNNQLTAPIPQAKQIRTFSKSSFDINWGLCGPPLSKNCERSPLPPSHYSEESGDSGLSGFCWKAVAIGYGCGFVIGLILGHIITSRSPYLVLRFFV